MEILTGNLFNKYPKIFVQYICKDFSIQHGWYPLIDELCQKIQENVDERKINQIRAIQVKQKFGSLRFYVNYHDEEISKYIQEAENKSMTICTRCSNNGTMRDCDGWYDILCNDCLLKNN